MVELKEGSNYGGYAVLYTGGSLTLETLSLENFYTQTFI